MILQEYEKRKKWDGEFGYKGERGRIGYMKNASLSLFPLSHLRNIAVTYILSVNEKPCRLREQGSWKEEWYHQESNRGHKDFQSFALPTELWHHRYILLRLQR